MVDDWLSLLQTKFRDEPGSCVAVHCVAGLGRSVYTNKNRSSLNVRVCSRFCFLCCYASDLLVKGGVPLSLYGQPVSSSLFR